MIGVSFSKMVILIVLWQRHILPISKKLCDNFSNNLLQIITQMSKKILIWPNWPDWLNSIFLDIAFFQKKLKNLQIITQNFLKKCNI